VHRNPFTVLQDPQLPDRRIDYVFLDATLERRLKGCELVFDEPAADGIHASDHFGVLVELA
jgi:endonuclease/exonuclease/phosphatase family metal-dependent hydrolase